MTHKQTNGKRDMVARSVQVVAIQEKSFNWKSLMPSARNKLVADGLFTPRGDITELGKSALAAIEGKQNP